MGGATTLSNGAWGVATSGSGWTTDNDVYLYDCGGNSAAFEECDAGDYGDTLCVFNNGSLWNGDRNFERSDQCSNGHPVFHFIERAAASSVAGLGEVDAVNLTLYLHYHEEAPYSDSNETVGQWLLSKDSVSVNALALCEAEDVRDCTASQWMVDTVTFEEGDLDNEFVDGLFQRVVDDHMTVTESQCAYSTSESEEQGSASKIMVIVIVTVLIMVGI